MKKIKVKKVFNRFSPDDNIRGYDIISSTHLPNAYQHNMIGTHNISDNPLVVLFATFLGLGIDQIWIK